MTLKLFLVVLIFISAAYGSRCQSPILLPSVQGQKQCTFNHHCRNVNCIVSSEGHNLTLGMKLKKCHEPPSVTVTLKQAQDNGNLNWSHSLKDGDKIKVPTSGKSFTGGLPVTESAIYVQVGLKKVNGSHINYKVSLVGHVTIYDTTSPLKVLLLQGQMPMWKRKDCPRKYVSTIATQTEVLFSTPSPTKQFQVTEPLSGWEGHHENAESTCPVVNFVDGTRCAVSNKCTKIRCRLPYNPDSSRTVLIIDVNECSNPMTATVTANSPSQQWSHTFEGGQEAKAPVPQGSDTNVFIHVELKKEANGDIHFKMISKTSAKDQSNNATLLETRLPQLSKCAEAKGHPKSRASWLHRKPATVKILAIVVPLVCLMLVGLGVSLWYFITRGMLRCPMHFSRRGGRSRVPMQRLVNAEI